MTTGGRPAVRPALERPETRPVLRDRPVVVVEDGNLEAALGHLKKRVQTLGVLGELKRRRAYESPGERRRQKRKLAAARRARAARQASRAHGG